MKDLAHEHSIVNLDNAKTIGVLYLANNKEQELIGKEFLEFLTAKGKKVTGLAFIKKLEKDREVGLPHITNKNVNFFYTPKGKLTEDFIKQKFDLLINLYTDEQLPLEYISALSPAKYRIGRFNETKTDSFDLMIDISEGEWLTEYIKLIHHYLDHINRNAKTV